jgi:endonuclease G
MISSATFVMTNMVPQTPDLNRGPWAKLESYARTLVTQSRALSIIAGCSGSQQTLQRTNAVIVPVTCWKVMVVLPPGGNAVDRINADTRGIAVSMPNTQGMRKQDWRAFLTTVREIEGTTGYDFLSNVPKDIQDQIETKKDTGRARAARPGTRARSTP